MCIEDIAISRRCVQKVTPVPDSTDVVLSPNPDRLAVRLSSAFAGQVNAVISDTPANAATFTGYVSGFLSSPLMSDAIGVWDLRIDYRTDGPAVQGQVVTRIVGAAGYVTETIMMPELAQLIREKLNNWKR